MFNNNNNNVFSKINIILNVNYISFITEKYQMKITRR